MEKSETDNRNSNLQNYDKSEKAEPESALLLGSQFQSAFKKPISNFPLRKKINRKSYNKWDTIIVCAEILVTRLTQ